ncbi:HAD family phosphatase [Methanolobus sp. ZRKC3]|uniref:HAD family hydrolase n=1 Tax=Methanolobus sp. ZRKC3 TaxID=3125786 RepID=UPI0032557905
MISSLIFDMDGVLLDSMPYHADAWVQVSGEWGVQVTHNDIYEIEGANHILGLQWLFQRAGKELEPEYYEAILDRKIEIFSKIADVRPFEGILECLGRLKGKFNLSVVTGSERSTVESLLNEFFPDVFDVVVCGDDVEHGKPFPDPYLKAVELLGVTVDECIVIENAPMGVEAAKGAGIFCVGVPTYVSPDKLSKADVVLTDHEFLPDYLLKLLNS